MKDNAFVAIQNIERLQTISKELRGSVVQQRIDYWMNRFFRFDKGKYSTRPKYLPRHEWYMAQVEVSSNVIFRSSRFCTSFFERLLDKFQRVGLRLVEPTPRRDCPTLSPECSADGQIAVPIPRASGDGTTQTPASNTGSEEIRSSSTTNSATSNRALKTVFQECPGPVDTLLGV